MTHIRPARACSVRMGSLPIGFSRAVPLCGDGAAPVVLALHRPTPGNPSLSLGGWPLWLKLGSVVAVVPGASQPKVSQQTQAIHARWSGRIPTREVAALIERVQSETGRGPRDLAEALGIGPTAWISYASGRRPDVPPKVVAAMRRVLTTVGEQARAVEDRSHGEPSLEVPLEWTEVDLLPMPALLAYWGRLIAGVHCSQQDRDEALCALFTANPIHHSKRWGTSAAVNALTLFRWRGGDANPRTLRVADRERLHGIVLEHLRRRRSRG